MITNDNFRVLKVLKNKIKFIFYIYHLMYNLI
jgi:hypothetical protein